MIAEVARLGRDNTIDLRFLADKVAVSIADFTKVILVDNAGDLADISSDDYPDDFDWNTGVKGKLTMALGNLSNHTITAGSVYIFRIIVFYPGAPNGVEWDRIQISFR